MKTMIQVAALGAMTLLGTMFASFASAGSPHCNNGGYRPLQPMPYSSYYGGGNPYHHHHHHHQHYQPSYQHGGYGGYGNYGYGNQPNYYGPNVNYRPYYGNQGSFGVYGAGGNGIYFRW